VDADGEPRKVDRTGLPVASVAELTGLLGDPTEAGWTEGMRVIVRRERPHPGAQISLWEAAEGWRENDNLIWPHCAGLIWPHPEVF
jgi:hypothetical protein